MIIARQTDRYKDCIMATVGVAGSPDWGLGLGLGVAKLESKRLGAHVRVLN